MLDTFISLAATAGEIGKVTAASLYPNGLIVIEVDDNGKPYTLTYCAAAEGKDSGNS